MSKRAPTPDGVLAAANRVAGQVVQTPLLPFQWQGKRVWAKAECLQHGGSFKLRGATNRLLQLSQNEREKGVVAFSSGNHAQGVAIAAKRLGVKATIVMPSDAPAVKRAATLAAGASIVDYDRLTESREEIGARIASETGATLVPSFDDTDVIEGQGSAGIEARAQMIQAEGAAPDQVIVPCGGGGLASGIALAIPEAAMVIVEPEGWNDMERSLRLGERVPVGAGAPATRCDALLTPLVSELTFDVLRRRGALGVAVSDGEVAEAMRFAARELRLVVEPGGAVALAALLSGKAGPFGERTIVVLSGGNVDLSVYVEMLTG